MIQCTLPRRETGLILAINFIEIIDYTHIIMVEYISIDIH